MTETPPTAETILARAEGIADPGLADVVRSACRDHIARRSMFGNDMTAAQSVRLACKRLALTVHGKTTIDAVLRDASEPGR